MKRSVVFLLAFPLLMPISLKAQEYYDEIYFVPSQKDKQDESTVEIISANGNSASSEVEQEPVYEDDNTSYFSQSNYTEQFDVDAYNRRYDSDESEYYESDDSYYASEASDEEEADYENEEDASLVLLDDDGTYTYRILRFHNPSLRIYLSSPYWIWDPYWDYVYDPWYYGAWYYSPYWGVPYAGWPWSFGWGWYGGWYHHAGFWGPPLHQHYWGWRTRNVTNRMGWRGQTFADRGIVRRTSSSDASRITTRGMIRNATTTNRSFQTNRGVRVNRNNGNTGTSSTRIRRNNSSNTVQRTNTGTQTQQRSTIRRSTTTSPSINRSSVSTPTRSSSGSIGGSRSGSFGSGGSRSGGRR